MVVFIYVKASLRCVSKGNRTWKISRPAEPCLPQLGRLCGISPFRLALLGSATMEGMAATAQSVRLHPFLCRG